ncbi:MAG: hypothetical protein SV775_18630 [Thermodesulfobacteriota bacterium]|nr:hypothetical protein [Thermodesulfobacteriota bacterium]
MEKEAGYLRSAWSYATGIDRGVNQPFTYGRRLSANFTEDHTKLQIKTEAAYQVPGYATIYGIDSAFNNDVFRKESWSQKNHGGTH